MKVYVNKTKSQKMVTFADGTSVFLKSGQKVKSDQKTKYVEKGVVVRDGVKPEPEKKATTTLTKKENTEKEQEKGVK